MDPALWAGSDGFPANFVLDGVQRVPLPGTRGYTPTRAQVCARTVRSVPSAIDPGNGNATTHWKACTQPGCVVAYGLQLCEHKFLVRSTANYHAL